MARRAAGRDGSGWGGDTRAANVGSGADRATAAGSGPGSASRAGSGARAGRRRGRSRRFAPVGDLVVARAPARRAGCRPLPSAFVATVAPVYRVTGNSGATLVPVRALRDLAGEPRHRDVVREPARRERQAIELRLQRGDEPRMPVAISRAASGT
jgi:hypothetical protein